MEDSSYLSPAGYIQLKIQEKTKNRRCVTPPGRGSRGGTEGAFVAVEIFESDVSFDVPRPPTGTLAVEHLLGFFFGFPLDQ